MPFFGGVGFVHIVFYNTVKVSVSKGSEDGICALRRKEKAGSNRPCRIHKFQNFCYIFNGSGVLSIQNISLLSFFIVILLM